MIDFKLNKSCNYKYDYEAIFNEIADKKIDEKTAFRSLILNDLFFIVYFVMQIEPANHPFVVNACREVEGGPKSRTLDLWAREHFKSTIITTAEVIQKILKNPEERIGIFSYIRPAAKAFLRSIKIIFENSDILKICFSHVLYDNPHAQSAKWSEDDGLIVKRNGFYKESTVEAWGLLEGMPTSKHYTHRVYDDIVTKDLVENPDTIAKLRDRFNLSQNLGTQDGTHRVVGTTYHHMDVLVYLKNKEDINGNKMYFTRIKPATDDGTFNGKPVLLSQEKLDELKADEINFNAQQLLDPTPVGIRKLDGSLLQEIDHNDIPVYTYKFMVIDPAGDDKTGEGDAWAILVIDVEPCMDNLGTSNIYISDACISPMRESEAIETITRMYIKNGMILQVGVEKVALSTTEIHVANALAVKGRRISIENETLVLLKPAGRKKTVRIERSLCWPLYNSKIFISKDISAAYRERLKFEMDKFPYWHDDGIDALSYLYDMIKDYRFGLRTVDEKYNKKEFERIESEYSWMAA